MENLLSRRRIVEDCNIFNKLEPELLAGCVLTCNRSMSKMGGGHGGDVTRKHVVTVALHLGLLYIPLLVGQGLG